MKRMWKKEQTRQNKRWCTINPNFNIIIIKSFVIIENEEIKFNYVEKKDQEGSTLLLACKGRIRRKIHGIFTPK